jgi:translation initiation factor 2B subunit (eIF-2B alpha/beta/delta family)
LRKMDDSSGVVEIYNDQRVSLGMGFLADHENIITCSHIFKDFNGEYLAKFIFDGNECWKKAKIVLKPASDVIAIKLIEDKPPEANPIWIRPDRYEDLILNDVTVRSLDSSIIIEGRIDKTDRNEFRISPRDDESRQSVKKGISGSLVANKLGYIGMIYVKKEYRECFAIPSGKIIDFCRSNDIYLTIKYNDWFEQADSVIDKLIKDYGNHLDKLERLRDLESRKSMFSSNEFNEATKSLREELVGIGFKNLDKIDGINKLCKFVSELSYDSDQLRESLKNIKALRELLAGFFDSEDVIRLNQISMFVMYQWEKFRIINDSPCYLNHNYTACDDTHSILVEEKLYELFLDALGVENDLKAIRDKYNNLNQSHRQEIIEKFRKLEKNKINAKELFLLIASSWLHDTGMIPPEGKRNDENFFARIEVHHHLSIAFIEEYKNELGLRGHKHIRDLKNIILSHRHKDYNALNVLHEDSIEYYSKSGVRPDLLAAYLRLADALQKPRRIKIETKMILEFRDPYSRYQWLKSQFVKTVIISKADHKVKLELRTIEVSGREATHLEALKEILRRELQNELDSINKVFIEWQANFYATAECDTDKLSDKLIMPQFSDLLSSIELFESNISPTSSAVIGIVLDQIRKILQYDNFENQNELDIKFKRSALDELRGYNDEVLRNIINIRQCHVPIRRVNCLLDEYLKDFDKKDDEKIIYTYGSIKQRIQELHLQRKVIKESLPEKAMGLIIDGLPILLYGYSRCIVKSFEVAINKFKGVECEKDNYINIIENIKNMPIYICEAATKNEYRYDNKLIYNDALNYIEALNNIGEFRNLYYIPDLCAANLFSKGMVSKVLFGANGIECDGHVHHTLGHLGIAELACFHKIPVYVIADSSKIGPVEANLEEQRGNNWLTTDTDKGDILSKKGINTYNPRGDRIAPKLVTSIVTEKGIIKPQDIRNHISFKILIKQDSLKSIKNVKEILEKLKSVYVDDASRKTTILNNDFKIFRKHLLIEKGEKGKESHSYESIRIDFYIDEMNAYLYILNIISDAKLMPENDDNYINNLRIQLQKKDEFAVCELDSIIKEHMEHS